MDRTPLVATPKSHRLAILCQPGTVAAYPASTFTGIDFHGLSIETIRERVAAGCADRTSFQVATSTDYEGTYDLICFVDCLHDMGDTRKPEHSASGHRGTATAHVVGVSSLRICAARSIPC